MFKRDPDKLGRQLVRDIYFNRTKPAKIEKIIRAGAYLEAVEHRMTPLYAAIVERRLDLLKILVEAGADVHAPRQSYGATPLMAAVGRDSGMFEYLIAKGADIHKKSSSGETLMFYLVGQNDVALIKRFQAEGLGLDAVSNDGKTLLMQAVYSNALVVARYFLEQGADIDATNHLGHTALHEAARYNRPEMVSLLLEQGADLHAKNVKGETPLALAIVAEAKNSLAVLHEADSHARKTAAVQQNGWVPSAEGEVTLFTQKDSVKYRLMQVFNFQSGLYTQIATNLDTMAESQAMMPLADFPDAALVQKAQAMLVEKGGTLPERLQSGGFAGKRSILTPLR